MQVLPPPFVMIITKGGSYIDFWTETQRGRSKNKHYLKDIPSFKDAWKTFPLFWRRMKRGLQFKYFPSCFIRLRIASKTPSKCLTWFFVCIFYRSIFRLASSVFVLRLQWHGSICELESDGFNPVLSGLQRHGSICKLESDGLYPVLTGLQRHGSMCCGGFTFGAKLPSFFSGESRTKI